MLAVVYKKIKAILRPIQRVINFVVNTIMLTLVYIFGVGSTYLIARLMKKELLSKKFENKKTYWQDVVEEKNINCYKQF